MNDPVRLSKFFSYLLRHRPDEAGLAMDKEGWVDVDALIAATRRKGFSVDRDIVSQVVADNDKKRFALSEDGSRIRAAQGHSTSDVNIAFVRFSPPTKLFHGTARRNLQSILAHGLRPGRRHYVHLSPDEQTAIAVGRRHGVPLVLLVASGAMHTAGYDFYRAENGVWLTRHVPAEFLQLSDCTGL